MSVFHFSRAAFRWFLRGVWTTVLWSLWLVLSLTFATEIYVAFSHELAIPPWMLRQIESRLQLSGLRAKFGGAVFSPSGEVFAEKIEIYAPSFEDPLLKVRALSFQVDPWALWVGEIEPHRLRADGVDFLVPAMLSPSGQTEAVIKDLYVALDPDRRNGVGVDDFAGKLGNVAITAHGEIAFPHGPRRGPKETHAAVQEMIQSYLQIARQVASATPQLQHLESPKLDLLLVPDDAHMARARIAITADSADAAAPLVASANAKSEIPKKIHAERVEARASTYLSGALPIDQRLELNIGSITTSSGDTLHGIRLATTGKFVPDHFTFEPDLATASIASASIHGLTVNDFMARVTPKPSPQFQSEIAFRTGGETWSVRAEGDASTKSGTVKVLGRISDPLFAYLGDRIGVKLTEILQPRQSPEIEVSAEFGPNGKFLKTSGRLSTGPVLAHGVSLDRARANFAFSENDLRVTDITLHQGDNTASGDYLMDTKTYDYRFLLDGRLRPIGISGWFKSWWPHFWSFFDFTVAPPVADVEVSGRWGAPEVTIVYVGVNCDQPVIRNVAFDHLVTSMFIRPDYYEGLSFFAERSRKTARGTFARAVDLEKDGYKTMDFNVVSNLDLQESARVFGQDGIEIVEPFVFATPPDLTLVGRLEGPASPNGEHQRVSMSVKSTGPFTFYGFPLSDLLFKGKISDDDLSLDEIHARFAGGQSEGKAQLVGKGDTKRLGFDYTVDGASLGEAIRVLEQFAAMRNGKPSPPQSKFQERLTSGRLNLHVAADGQYNDTASYHGSGTADVTNAHLGEINLLGALSRTLRGSSVLNFTSFRLTTVHTDFTLAKGALDFSELRITGPTAAIDLKGRYSLDAKQMDFNAKVYPFEEGKTLLANAVDLVLTPISRALELKLTGAIDQPNWRFVFGPTSLLRTITGTKEGIKPTEPADPEEKSMPPPLLRR